MTARVREANQSDYESLCTLFVEENRFHAALVSEYIIYESTGREIMYIPAGKFLFGEAIHSPQSLWTIHHKE